MITRLRMLVFFVLLAIGIAPMTSRAETLEPLDLHLVMSMAGVTAGSLMLSIDPKDDRIESSLRMKSRGMFKFLTGYKSCAEGQSLPGVDGEGPMPVSYDSTYKTKNTERKVQIRYDATDGRITDLQSWKRGKPRKSKVPEDLRQETMDPLTAVLQVRHWVREIREAFIGDAAIGDVEAVIRSFEIFDGRRRYRLNAKLLERKQIAFDGKTKAAFRFKVELAPLAGFSKKDMLANWASEDGKRWIELIVTDDDNPLPVSLQTKGGTLETSIYLRKVCTGENGCNKVGS